MRTLAYSTIGALLIACAASAPAVAQSSSQGKAGAMNLTIYHIEGRRSERVVWLCEELGLPYKLEYKRGDIAASMNTIRGVSPLMPVAPTVNIYGQVMVESGAIMELILAREGKGRLVPAVDSPDYPYYLQWMHYAEGSLASRIIADYRVGMLQGGLTPPTPGRPRLVDGNDVVKFADDFLSKHPHFGGAQFSAADIIMLFPLTIADSFGVSDMTQYPNVVAWRKKVEERPAYKKMLAAARPDGVPGAPRPLPKKQ
jgi:glutathione S-transferase